MWCLDIWARWCSGQNAGTLSQRSRIQSTSWVEFLFCSCARSTQPSIPSGSVKWVSVSGWECNGGLLETVWSIGHNIGVFAPLPARDQWNGDEHRSRSWRTVKGSNLPLPLQLKVVDLTGLNEFIRFHPTITRRTKDGRTRYVKWQLTHKWYPDEGFTRSTGLRHASCQHVINAV